MSDIPAHLQTLLMDQIADSLNGVAVLDQQDVILYHNRTFAAMFGFQGETKIGQTLNNFISWLYSHKITVIDAETLDDWLLDMQNLHRSAPFRKVEIEFSDQRWLLLSAQLYNDGSMILACTDISQIKETEFALEAARMELEIQAMTDELTGLANRRHFFQQLKLEFGRARRHRMPVCLAMLDLDYFKSVNDKHGHPAGDRVLQHFAGLLRHGIREHDLCGRLGGEEFAIVFPQTQAIQARNVLERIRSQLHQHVFADIGAGLSYRFSAGIVDLASSLNDLNQWLSLADQALYDAKQQGRDRILVR